MGLTYPWVNQLVSLDVMGKKCLEEAELSFLEVVFPSAGT